MKLTTDGKTNFLTLEQPENVTPKERGTTGLYHFAILLPSRTHLANIVIHFVKNNIQFGSADHLVSEALYFKDPDGNEIEIYRDRHPSEWNWHGEEVEMATIPLDFEDLLKNATPNKSWSKMPEDTLMGHIHLHVSEVGKYGRVLCKRLRNGCRQSLWKSSIIFILRKISSPCWRQYVERCRCTRSFKNKCRIKILYTSFR